MYIDITFRPKEWEEEPCLRCDVYVNGELQSTRGGFRKISCYKYTDSRDSRLDAEPGWIGEGNDPWLKLDLLCRQVITGIRFGTHRHNTFKCVTKLAIDFE